MMDPRARPTLRLNPQVSKVNHRQPSDCTLTLSEPPREEPHPVTLHKPVAKKVSANVLRERLVEARSMRTSSSGTTAKKRGAGAVWERWEREQHQPIDLDCSTETPSATTKIPGGTEDKASMPPLKQKQKLSRGEFLMSQPAQHSQINERSDGKFISGGDAAKLQRKLRIDSAPCSDESQGQTLSLSVIDAGVQHNLIMLLAQTDTEVFDVVLRLCKAKESIPALVSRPAGHGILQTGENIILHGPWLECSKGSNFNGNKRRLIFFPAEIAMPS